MWGKKIRFREVNVFNLEHTVRKWRRHTVCPSPPLTWALHCQALHSLHEEVWTLKRYRQVLHRNASAYVTRIYFLVEESSQIFGIPSLKKAPKSYGWVSKEEWTFTQHTITPTHLQSVAHAHTSAPTKCIGPLCTVDPISVCTEPHFYY